MILQVGTLLYYFRHLKQGHMQNQSTCCDSLQLTALTSMSLSPRIGARFQALFEEAYAELGMPSQGDFASIIADRVDRWFSKQDRLTMLELQVENLQAAVEKKLTAIVEKKLTAIVEMMNQQNQRMSQLGQQMSMILLSQSMQSRIPIFPSRINLSRVQIELLPSSQSQLGSDINLNSRSLVRANPKRQNKPSPQIIQDENNGESWDSWDSTNARIKKGLTQRIKGRNFSILGQRRWGRRNQSKRNQSSRSSFQSNLRRSLYVEQQKEY